MLKCPSRWEMDADVALNVGITSIGRPNRYELLAWLNESLQTGFTKIEQICTGAAYCQLMHWLFPRTLDLSRVRFQSIDMVDIIHNYGLLQAAFRKVGVLRYIPMDELTKRNSTVVLTFTQWFKAFFDRNNSSDREYHALEARGGQSMVPAEPDDPPSQSPPQKLEIIVKMAGKQVEVPRKEKATESLKKDADVIVLISDDEDDVMVVTPVPKTKKMDTMVKDKSQEEMTVGVRAQQQAEKMDTMVKDKVQEEMNVDVRVQHQAKKMDTTLKDKAQDEMKVGVRVQHQAEKTDVTVKEEVQEMNVDVRVQRQAEKMDTTVKDKAQEEMKMGVRVQQQAEKMDVTVKEEVQEEMNVDVRVQHRAEKVDTTMKDKAQEEIKVEVEAEATVKENDSWLDFITRHFPDNVDLRTEAQVSATLNPTQLDNIRQICSRWPYSLYLYVGLQLGGCQNTGVVLVGYFNQVSGDSVVRPLLTLQMNVVEMDSQTSADTHTFKDMYFIHDDACLLVETLKKIDISLANMAAFYCNVPHPRMSRVFVSKLQAFNPKLVSLCGLPGMATRACEAGLLTSFSCVLELIRDVHYHYYTCPSASSSLRLFTDAESYNPSLPLSAQCLFIIHTVQRMVSNWRGLVDYFKSVRQVGDTCLITDRLMDNKFKLRFIFLSHILEPLRALQELQQSDTAGVAVQLQLTSMLVNSYAASILRPAVAERFLRKRDLNHLQYRTELLPVSEVHVGARAKEFLWATAVVDLGEEERTDFMKDAASFYKAALQTLTESLPEHLGEGALKNIDRLLKHSDNVWRYKMSDETLYELTNQLGLNRPEKNQLSYDYKSFIKIVNKQKLHCWPKMLHVTRPASALRSLLLTLLTLPTSLCRKHVFAKVFNKALQNSPDFTTVSPQPCSWEGIPRIKKLRKPVKAGNSGKRKKEVVKQMEKEKKKEESSSEDGEVVAKPSLNLPFKHFTNEDSDTDNSSDVVDVTEESKLCRTSRLMTKTQSERTPQAQDAYSVDVDDDSDNGDGDVMITSAAPAPAASLDAVGELVWGQVEGFSLWPAIIVPSWGESQHSESRMVEWYGQNMTSQVSVQSLKPFATFAQNFCCNSFAILATYREAIFLSLQEAALRCKKQFSALDEDRYELLKQMLDWAFGGFKPTGPDGLKPTADTNDVTKLKKQPKKIRKEVFLESSSSPSSSVSSNSNVIEKPTSKKTLSKNSTGKSSHKSVKTWEAWDVGFDSAGKATKGVGLEKGRGKGGKLLKKKVHPFDGFHDDDNSPDFVPFKKKNTKIYNKVNETTSSYTQPDQKLRDETIRKIMDMKLDIEGFCLCCGTENVEIFHPLFKGSLCLPCKDNLTETLYRYDEDGYQSYCTICCYGLEVILCGNDGCCRSYCADCLNILVSPGSFESLKEQDPWICYLCQPHQPHGALTPREDWSIRVQELFANNSAMEFEPHRVYPSIPANLRRPARVLSLFDGIATGYVVLKDLGIKVETYVASEVCEDSVAVATINHDGKIIHVGDARYITQEHLDQWGPFDLLIGGSPCNDLSIVNPIRKGLYEGTGRLFFEFYRILQLLKPKDKDPRPFFWLFENVVFMNTHDKVNICRFLECNPVLVDAVKVSPAHRARYFWGNIPGMSRPITASQNDKLNLQDCLEIGREARVTKVRTITTNPNSMKQGKGFLLPVLDNNKEDILWITEVEKIFGFPKHYTDVRNMNRQQRQKVLGKAWSVPVIRHLFAPLKDYFACEELPPLTSSTSLSSPASPELQQLR